MKRPRVLGMAAGLIVLVAALPPVYYLWARLHGEHFFLARPTSYWSGQLRQSHRGRWSPPAPDRLLIAVGLEKETGQPAVLEGGPSALPVLLDLMRDEDVTTSELAIDAIRDLGSSASPAIPSLEKGGSRR